MTVKNRKSVDIICWFTLVIYNKRTRGPFVLFLPGYEQISSTSFISSKWQVNVYLVYILPSFGRGEDRNLTGGGGGRDLLRFMCKQLAIRSWNLNGFGRIGPATIFLFCVLQLKQNWARYIWRLKVSERIHEEPHYYCCTHINTREHTRARTQTGQQRGLDVLGVPKPCTADYYGGP